MQTLDPGKTLSRARMTVISHIAQKLHANYILMLESLIKRYEAHLWLTYTNDISQLSQSLRYQDQIVHDLQDIGHGYIAVAASMGYERALRDLVNAGYIKW